MPIPRTEITLSRQGTILSRKVLTPGRYLVGSDAEDLRVDGPGVSPVHAQLSLNAHLLTVEDMGSEYGTFIEEERLKGPRRLFPNQALRLGPEVELRAVRLRDGEDDAEASLSIQQAYVDRLLPPELRSRLKHVIQGKVASGGMGTIYRAREMTIRREVAMKVMLSQVSEGAIARFIKEAQVTGQLEHPNIVPIHELGVDDQDQLYYTMKYVRGVTLKDVLDQLAAGDAETVRQFPLQRLLSILEKVCDAVAFAHSRRVVHRDLKPENIMLGKFGEVLVMDWGLSLSLGHEAGNHPAGGGEAAAPGELVSLLSSDAPGENGLAGTPQYMAPEQARGEVAAIDTRCDIYALGAILFHILHLERPIPGETVQEVLSNVRTGRTRLDTIPSRARHADGQFATVSLGAVVRKAMAPEAAGRYATVEELQAEIRNYASGFATRAEEAGVTRHLLLGLVRYRKEAIWLSAFAAVLVAVGSVSLVRFLQEHHRAEAALADLRDTAPSFIAQAVALARLQQFQEALGKVDYSLRLRPDNVEAYLLKGDLHEALLQLPAAAACYREALRLDPGSTRARANAELCERLAPRCKEEGDPPGRETLNELYHAMMAEKREAFLVRPVGMKVGQGNLVTRRSLEEQLDQLVTPVDRDWSSRLTVLPDGHLEIDLSHTSVSNLAPLAGMPVTTLNLRHCDQVKDLNPLRGLPLTTLLLDGAGVTDLGPLKDLRLEELSISGTGVSDLSPLGDSPLRRLDCSHISAQSFSALARTRLEELSLAACSPGNLAFLRGLPLRQLNLDRCPAATGFSALKDLHDLEVLTLPEQFYDLPANELRSLRDLRTLPLLRRILIGATALSPTEGGMTAGEFWDRWDRQLNWLEAVHGANGELKPAPDNTWQVIIPSPVADITFLKGMPIRRLILLGAPVVDLHPLAGMPLECLDLRKTNVTDLEPLRGLPLKELYLWENAVSDFSVISSFPDLEALDLTQTAFADLTLLKSRRMRLLRLGSTRVTDLSPLAGMYLEKLHCDSVPVTSVRPLLECQGLRWLVAPKSATDLDLLEGLSTLERISFDSGPESRPTDTAVDFWSLRKPKPPPPSPPAAGHH